MDENLQQSEVSIIPTETTPAKGQFPKKKLKAIFPAAIIILCAVAAIIINANRPINRFDHALKAGEYGVASAIYEQNSSDEKFVAKTMLVQLLSFSMELRRKNCRLLASYIPIKCRYRARKDDSF